MIVSLNFRQAFYAAETGRYPISLITIEHEDLTEIIRISSDPTQRLVDLTTPTDVVYGTISRGETFIFYPVRLRLPNDTEDGLGDLSIEIDNVHRQFTEIIRTLTSPPTFKVEIVIDNALDVVEAQWPDFELVDVKYDATLITGTLKLETYEKEPFPSGMFTPTYFPGLF